MIFKFRCQTCNWPTTKRRSPSAVAAYGQPKFCDIACAADARRGAANPMWNGGGTHGTAYTYQTRECRCEPCVRGNSRRKKAQHLARLTRLRLEAQA